MVDFNNSFIHSVFFDQDIIYGRLSVGIGIMWGKSSCYLAIVSIPYMLDILIP